MSAVARALVMVLLPVAVFAGTGYPMMQLTGRAQFPRTEAAESVPLNFRAAGYDTAGARAYWQWLGPDGRAAERRFLLVDLAFPLGYGGAMLASLWLAGPALAGRRRLPWLAAPVAATVAADWAENLIHLRQLQRFLEGAELAPSWIGAASVATSVKTACFYASSLLILGLAAAAVVVRARRAGGAA